MLRHQYGSSKFITKSNVSLVCIRTCEDLSESNNKFIFGENGSYSCEQISCKEKLSI